jgi:DNA-3-methyladenine glycosylase I
VIENAKAAILLIKEFKSLHAYFSFMLKGVNVADPAITQVAQSTLTQTISKDLKKRGFKFVGPTTVQAFLQASGLFHAHDQFCFKSYLSKKNEKTKK